MFIGPRQLGIQKETSYLEKFDFELVHVVCYDILGRYFGMILQLNKYETAPYFFLSNLTSYLSALRFSEFLTFSRLKFLPPHLVHVVIEF